MGWMDVPFPLLVEAIQEALFGVIQNHWVPNEKEKKIWEVKVGTQGVIQVDNNSLAAGLAVAMEGMTIQAETMELHQPLILR